MRITHEAEGVIDLFINLVDVLKLFDRFIQTALATLIVGFTEILNAAPDLQVNWRAAAIAAVTGALAAAFRAVVGAGTQGESPAKGFGLPA